MVRINSIPTLVQIMAWCRPGDKHLNQRWLVYWRIYASLSLNEIYASLYWVGIYPSNALSPGAKPSPEPTLSYSLSKGITFNEIWTKAKTFFHRNTFENGAKQSHGPTLAHSLSWEITFSQILTKMQIFPFTKCISKCRLHHGDHVVYVSLC